MAFETWGIVELMGHARIAGNLTETTLLGTSLLRVDVPKTTQREAFTKYYGAAAIYCITPTDMMTATLAAEKFNESPVQPWILPAPQNPVLFDKLAGRLAVEIVGDDEDEEWFEDDDAADESRLLRDLEEF